MGVVSRTIFDVKHGLEDARIYDTASDVTVVTRAVVNSGTIPESTQVRLEYRNSIWMTWNRRTTTLFKDATTTITAGVPSIVDGRVEIRDNFEGTVPWGHTKELVKPAEITQYVTLPPKTRVKVSLVASQGKCEVPFSYVVREVLSDNEFRAYHVDDGVYTGTNYYNHRVVITEEPLQ